MAIIAGLTTLANVKTTLGIATADTSQDGRLELLINEVSAVVPQFLGLPGAWGLARTTHTAEAYAVNSQQYVYTMQWPIQGNPSVTLNGGSLVLGQQFYCTTEDALIGRLYNPTGWSGNYYVRGTTLDPVAGKWDLLLTYVAGYYLPADTDYGAGDADSLPLAISAAVEMEVARRFRNQTRAMQGLEAYSEGGISMTFAKPLTGFSNNMGLCDEAAGMLTPYRRYIVA